MFVPIRLQSDKTEQSEAEAHDADDLAPIDAVGGAALPDAVGTAAASLQSCETAYQTACEALLDLARAVSLDELRALSCLSAVPTGVELLLACVRILIAPDDFVPSELTWSSSAQWLGGAGACELHPAMHSLDEAAVSSATLRKCAPYLLHPKMKQHEVEPATARVLCDWLHTKIGAVQLHRQVAALGGGTARAHVAAARRGSPTRSVQPTATAEHTSAPEQSPRAQMSERRVP